jgi:methionyl-tRNA formyltransferase
VLKVIFMGTPDYADAILKRLIEDSDIEVVAVYTQPDKPVGRKKLLTPPPVKVTAQEHNIALYQPERLREDAVVSELLKIECDYIVVAAYGQILPREILDHAPCINLHASVLPQYRGASPIQQTLLNGDNITGVTAMLMEEGLDTGDILKIKTINVDKDEVASSLFKRLTDVAAELAVDVVKKFQNYLPKKQNESEASHCKKITKADGALSFDEAAQSIYNKYRAFTPWPGVYLLESGLKLKEIKLRENEKSYRPGEILAIESNGVVVGCKQGSLLIIKVQPMSKKEMDALAYINGKRLQVADILI